jgi:hypothetical protein
MLLALTILVPVGDRFSIVSVQSVGVILATIRADATVASERDRFCDPTVHTLVGEEAATLILAGPHLVGFVEFYRTGVIFFCKAKCSPVAIVLEYVCVLP